MDQAVNDLAVAVLALNVLTEIKMGGLANLRFLNLWPGCLINLIPTRMGLLIRLKSMPCVKTSPKAGGARVEVVFKEAKHVLVGLAVKAEDKHVPEDLGEDNDLVVVLGEKPYRGKKREARGNAHIARRSFPPQICPSTCVNARRTLATKYVPEDLGGDHGLEVKVEEKLRRV